MTKEFNYNQAPLTRRFFLFCAGSAVALSALPALAKPPAWSGHEQQISNAITRYVARVSAAGIPVDKTAMTTAVSQELRWAGRAAPWLKVYGKYLGPLGLGLSVAAAMSVVYMDTSKSAVSKTNSDAGSVPGTIGDLIDSLGEDGARGHYSNGYWYWRTVEPYGYSTNKYQPEWDFYTQINDPEPMAGHKLVVWYKSAPGTSAPAAKPYEDHELTQPKLAALPDTAVIAGEDVVSMLNEIFGEAHETSPEAVPSPSLAPLTLADLGTDTWKANALAENTAADRDADVDGGGTDGDGGTGGGDGFPDWPEGLSEPSGMFFPEFVLPEMGTPGPGECPKLEAEWKGQMVGVNPCPQLEQIRPLVGTVLPLVYLVGALKMLMFNGK